MRYLIVAMLFTMLFTQGACVSTGTSGKTTDASMEWRMKSLEESFLNYREEQRRQAEQLDRMQSDTDRRLSAVEDALADVEGRDDAVVVEGAPKRADVPDEGWVTDLKPEDEGWKEVKPEQGAKAAPQNAPAEAPKVAASSEPKPWAKVPQPKPAPAPAMTAQSLYKKGYAQYEADKTADARKTFDEFLAKYPKSSLAANALYWKGETYYSDKNYPQAIMTFKDVVSRYPKHHKAASAMLKIGMSYELVGDKDNAVFYFRALVDDYPSSEPASMARKRLQALGE
ncbi:tol-pal system protein YbgF [Salidesulfovibrio onnuriiensis]|uniref:tol-pal system protein YbgF n=1 Tax=Salidesulfovibrio onnuriiensis TaxID=2583823 RepID=UPI0011CC2B05|nr:tol-pal system protein YbgF [Salidesulfovibrio onnuriiensis]